MKKTFLLSVFLLACGSLLAQNIFNSTGHVGIGATDTSLFALTVSAPGGAMNVGGNAHINSAFIQDQTTYRGIYAGYDAPSQTGVLCSATSEAASQMAFWGYTGSAWTERMRIDVNKTVKARQQEIEKLKAGVT